MIRINSSCHVKIKGEEYQYGYFTGEWKEKMEGLGFYSPIWVNASSKMKSIDVTKTYIQFRDKTLTYQYALGDEKKQDINSLNFFYIYYRATPQCTPNIQGLKDFLFNKIKNY